MRIIDKPLYTIYHAFAIDNRYFIFYLLSSKNTSLVYYMNEQRNCFYINPGTAYVVLFLFGAGKVVYMN